MASDKHHKSGITKPVDIKMAVPPPQQEDEQEEEQQVEPFETSDGWWVDAFKPGVNHGDPGATKHGFESPQELANRKVWKAQWDKWRASLGIQQSYAELDAVKKKMDPNNPWDHTKAFGYIGTYNSRNINKILFDPANAGKPIESMFKRPQDVAAVKAMDSLIAKNTTKENGVFTRYMDGADLIAKNYGVSKEIASAMVNIAKSGSVSKSTLTALSNALKGVQTNSAAYSSTSANRTLNVFQKAPIMRTIRVPKGTQAYTTGNSVESEVIFGRGMQTKVIGVTVQTLNGHKHLVIEEEFTGYKK